MKHNLLKLLKVLPFLLSFQTQAQLIPETRNGVNVVYDTVDDITWLQDANLFQTMASNMGASNLVSAILNDTPVIHRWHAPADPNQEPMDDPIILNNSNFYGSSATDAAGAYAFTQYLNDTGYAGYSNWQLPTYSGLSVFNNLLSQLGYPNGIGNLLFQGNVGGQVDIIPFLHMDGLMNYWFVTNFYDVSAWQYSLTNNSAASISFGNGYGVGIPWLIAPGNIGNIPTNPVPLPGAFGLFGFAISCIFLLRRNKAHHTCYLG